MLLKLSIIWIGLIFLIIPQKVFAVTVSIVNYPSIITDEAFTVIASVFGATAGTNYLRIDLFKDGSTSYFGETFNNADWYGGSIYSQYFPITIQTGTVWGGILQGRAGSPSISQYDGSGIYKMRLRRYTSGGGYTTLEANNSAVVVSINVPTPTPTPTPVPSSVQATSTSIPTPTPIPSPSLSPIPTKIFVDLTSDSSDEAEILGTSSAQSPRTFETAKPEVKILEESENILQRVFIILGILTIITSAGIFIRQKWIK